MKKTIATATVVLMLLAVSVLIPASCARTGRDKDSKTGQDSISISGAFALYPMVVLWADEYRKEYPDVRIDITAGGAGKGMADTLAGAVDFGMVSRGIYPEETDKGATAFPVARDAVVGTLNANHPLAERIAENGMTREDLAALFLGEGGSRYDLSAFTVYTRSDSSGAAQMWAEYLGAPSQDDLIGTGVSGDPGVLEAVRQDHAGIGFNNIGYAFSHETGRPYEDIMVIPLDLDASGTLEPSEKCYSTLSDVARAVKEGRYPSPPARDLYLVTKGIPSQGATADLLEWILTKGQVFVETAGYIPVHSDQIQTALEQLDR